MRARNPVPKLEHDRTNNAGVCHVYLANGVRKRLHLGEWGTTACNLEYARVVQIVTANGGVWPCGELELRVNEALVRYTKFVEQHYANADGTPGPHAEKIKWFLGPLRTLYGRSLLHEFGPIELKTIRAHWIDKKIVRKQANKGVGIIRQFFRWCVEERLCDANVWETLKAVRSLEEGRGGSVEGKDREPANAADVEKTIPHLPPVVQQIVRLLRLTGARPCEIVRLRVCDIDTSGAVWFAEIKQHKTALKGKDRVIRFGPQAVAILRDAMQGLPPTAYLFSPARQADEVNRARTEKRKTPRYPSHMRRNAAKRVAKPKLPPGEFFTPLVVARAVNRACDKAGCPPWTPYMLRHLVAVELRERFGLEHVRAVLGHSAATMAAHYAKRADEKLATEAVLAMG